MSLKDNILKAPDSAILDLPLPEWNETIYLRQWSGNERNRVTKLGDDTPKLMETVLWLSICEENGNRCFDEKSVKPLLEKNHLVLERIVKEALKHNGLHSEAAADAKKD